MADPRQRPFVAGNWKMNLTLPEARDLVSGVLGAGAELGGATVVLVPPFTLLAPVARLLEGSKVGLGGQDLFWEDRGAFTGEVSGPMLREAGCSYVLVGHSERRQLFGETDEAVNRKARAALRSGLTPIVCVGETLKERRACRTEARVDGQLEAGLEGLSDADMERVVLAYEPVWAIGTGQTATPAQAGEVHTHIRRRLEKRYGNRAASCAIILYGGSVKPANSNALFREEDIDGFLVGGASLDAASFVGIVRETLRADKEVP
ncbi:MAG TPA: triose-phosphate isomerase [Terriglobales bacterium]|nr:triose-phosphate isomerase [Terriglobales bacterium]